MSEEKKNQYLLIVGDIEMGLLSNVMPGIKYIPIEGMNIEGNESYQFLVSPLPKVEKSSKPEEVVTD